MFERFTDRARQVLVHAQDEARDLGHDHIGPEHLVLGLFQAGGIAAVALSQLGADVDRARRCIAEGIPSSAAMSKAGKMPFSPRAKKSLELSLREALRLHHNYIGTEHLLLGILRMAEKDPGVVGSALGVDADRLRNRVIELLDGRLSASKLRSIAFDNALDKARGQAGSGPMTTGQMVSAVLADPGSQGAKALASLGVTEESFAAALAQVPVDGTTDGPPRSMEVRIGNATTTIDDPDLIESLAGLPADELRTTFELLKRAIKERRGPGAAA